VQLVQSFTLRLLWAPYSNVWGTALHHLSVAKSRALGFGTWIALVSVSRVVSNTGTFRKRLLSGDTSRHGDYRYVHVSPIEADQ